MKKTLRTAFRPIIRRQARRQVELIRDTGIAFAPSIADALEEVLAAQLSPEERSWADRIESLRSELAQNTAPVSVIDFGAGRSTDHRSAEEMSAGIANTTTVAKACGASKPHFWCLLLFKLVRKLKPKVGVELGTCLGISAAYQAAAQQLNGYGKFITLEGAPALASLSEGHLQSLGLENASVVPGRFLDTLESALQANAPIDYAFIDGHHDERATIDYYRQFLPHLTEESVLIFDDIAWSDGMQRAWRTLEHDKHVALSINLRNVGICVVSKGESAEKQQFALRLPT